MKSNYMQFLDAAFGMPTAARIFPSLDTPPELEIISSSMTLPTTEFEISNLLPSFPEHSRSFE